eukprot:TRINITY_DN5394_c0_g1_i9.p1 TRINITY_DN5394_c0_g1~~TRINITY_DN5394_c0_g1_i9.p1  ORF type:complete len:652 (+),score=130.92 TRINITY_DN5394_c0_g1_i9:79-2034(+)
MEKPPAERYADLAETSESAFVVTENSPVLQSDDEIQDRSIEIREDLEGELSHGEDQDPDAADLKAQYMRALVAALDSDEERRSPRKASVHSSSQERSMPVAGLRSGSSLFGLPDDEDAAELSVGEDQIHKEVAFEADENSSLDGQKPYELIAGRKSQSGMATDIRSLPSRSLLPETDDFVNFTATHEISQVTPVMSSLLPDQTYENPPETPPEIRKRIAMNRFDDTDAPETESRRQSEIKSPDPSELLTTNTTALENPAKDRKTRFSLTETQPLPTNSDILSPGTHATRSIGLKVEKNLKQTPSLPQNSNVYQQPNSEDEKDVRELRENYYQLVLKDHTDNFLSALEKRVPLAPLSPIKGLSESVEKPSSAFETKHSSTSRGPPLPETPLHGQHPLASIEAGQLAYYEPPPKTRLSLASKEGSRHSLAPVDEVRGMPRKVARNSKPSSRVGSASGTTAALSTSKSLGELARGKSITPRHGTKSSRHQVYSAPTRGIPQSAHGKAFPSDNVPTLPSLPKRTYNGPKLQAIQPIAPISLPPLVGSNQKKGRNNPSDYNSGDERRSHQRDRRSTRNRRVVDTSDVSSDDSDLSSFSFLSSDSQKDFNPENLTAMGKAHFALHQQQKHRRKVRRERDRVMLKWLNQLDTRYVSDQ